MPAVGLCNKDHVLVNYDDRSGGVNSIVHSEWVSQLCGYRQAMS